jgi:hypothetical protein
MIVVEDLEVNMWQTIAAAAMAVAVGNISAMAQNTDTSAQQRPPSQQQGRGVRSAVDSTATMTFVGCLIRESDYRRTHALGKGGVAGLRTGSDFVLVDAKTDPADSTPSTSAVSSTTATVSAGPSASCVEVGTGEAYRLAGKREGELKPFIGHYIEITGRFEHAHDAKAAAGETTAKLPVEIVVASYRPASLHSETPVIATSGQTPSQPSPSAQGVPTPPSAQTARELPRTASNEPLILLIGLLSMSAAIAVTVLRRRVA